LCRHRRSNNGCSSSNSGDGRRQCERRRALHGCTSATSSPCRSTTPTTSTYGGAACAKARGALAFRREEWRAFFHEQHGVVGRGSVVQQRRVGDRRRLLRVDVDCVVATQLWVVGQRGEHALPERVGRLARLHRLHAQIAAVRYFHSDFEGCRRCAGGERGRIRRRHVLSRGHGRWRRTSASAEQRVLRGLTSHHSCCSERADTAGAPADQSGAHRGGAHWRAGWRRVASCRCLRRGRRQWLRRSVGWHELVGARRLCEH